MKTDAEFRQLRVSHLLIGLRAQRHWLPEGSRVQGTEKSTPVVITKEDIKRLACWILLDKQGFPLSALSM